MWSLLLLACAGPGEPPVGWGFELMPLPDYPPLVTDLFFHDDQLVVADKSGLIVRYDASGRRTGSLQLQVYDDNDCGLLSMARSPGFDTDGLLYLGACSDLGGSEVIRITLDWDAFSSSDRVQILQVSDPGAVDPWHNVGWIGFDADGALLALFGEKNTGAHAQDRSTLLGAVARILPSTAPGVGGYTVPGDNPLTGEPGVDPALFASGLRSPWSGALDVSGRLWVGDVGSSSRGFEELNLVTPGANLGWPRSEGRCLEDCADLTDPVLSYPHDLALDHPYFSEDPETVPTALRVIWVAPGHTGIGADPYGGRLTDRVLFGDTCMGFVRSVATDPAGAITGDTSIGHLTGITAWGQGWGGHLYASRIDGCLSDSADRQVSRLFRLVYR